MWPGSQRSTVLTQCILNLNENLINSDNRTWQKVKRSKNMWNWTFECSRGYCQMSVFLGWWRYLVFHQFCCCRKEVEMLCLHSQVICIFFNYSHHPFQSAFEAIIVLFFGNILANHFTLSFGLLWTFLGQYNSDKYCINYL